MSTDDIPPTEPTKPTATAERKPRKRATSKAAGADLAPDLESNRIAIERSHWYWLGALPGCPSEHLDLHGVHFPKLTERVKLSKNGPPQRIPQIGTLAKLTEGDIQRLRERLKRTVIRFRTPPSASPVASEDMLRAGEDPIVLRAGNGVGIELGDAESWKPRRGAPVTIPTQVEIQQRERHGLSVRRYRQEPLDEPAARYLFCVLCDDQERGNRGEAYPPSLEETGLEWPGDTD